MTLPLRAGRLDLTFEPATGGVRWVRFGGVEVLRGIYGAVRDSRWNTVPARVEVREVRAGDEVFRVTFDARYERGDVRYTWRGTIEGRDGVLTYAFDGEAGSDFLKNRIGLCVLHPLSDTVGQPCEVVHTDGRVEEQAFPELVSPHQPFFDVRELRHTSAHGLRVAVSFEGETFETEDQRNWSDASFKTYSTPLADPFPVLMRAGQRTRHVVTLRVSGEVRPVPAEAPPTAPVRPRLGVALDPSDLTPARLERLRSLGLDHLRLDVRFEDGWRERLREAAGVGVPLEAALFVRSLDDLRTFAEAAQDLQLVRVLPFEVGSPTTSASLVREARSVFGPSVAIASGSNVYFAELNRARPTDEADTLVFPLNPGVHASDAASSFETFEAHAAMLHTARAFAPGRGIVVSPVTLDPFDPSQVAEVHPSSEAAGAWVRGAFASLAAAGAEAVTFFEPGRETDAAFAALRELSRGREAVGHG
ncbi:hypothetical protein [Deinococcus planocerae]|uniref:hypothetical protein n=1 Tax=Deinococcus planocerae TaxID=1737569 RepID=UPI000C7F3358|nr:hypothetical protein [Deinococcus planocerae]